jgi:hypothetical protein
MKQCKFRSKLQTLCPTEHAVARKRLSSCWKQRRAEREQTIGKHSRKDGLEDVHEFLIEFLPLPESYGVTLPKPVQRTSGKFSDSEAVTRGKNSIPQTRKLQKKEQGRTRE